VHYVVTEYGVANLFGRNLRERVEALISIAHPDFRAELETAAKERKLLT
jgi:acyl-CoA hydrolase